MKRFISPLHLPLVLTLLLCSGMPAICQEIFEQTNGPYGGDLFAGIVANDGTVYVATVNFEVFRSADQGRSWERTPAARNQLIERVAADSSGSVYSGGDYGVWSSTDQGRSWRKNGPGLPYPSQSHRTQIRHTEVTEQGTVLAVMYNGLRRDSDSLYRSTDKGATWTVSTELAALGTRINGLSAAGGVIHVGIGPKIYRSTDEGLTWSPAGLSLESTGDTIQSIVANGEGELWVTTLSTTLYHSTDRGVQWQRRAALGLPPNSIVSALVDHHRQLLIGVVNGDAYVSTDRGESWTLRENETFRRAQVSEILSAPSGVLYAIGQGALVSADNARTWDGSVSGLIASSLFSLEETGSGAILAGTPESIMRSSDGGERWDTSGTGIPTSLIYDISAFDNGVLLAGTRSYGVMRSTDDGRSWAAANVGLTVSNVNQIEIVGASEALAATTSGVFRTTDAGASWSATGPGIGTSFVSSVIRSGGMLFAGTAGPTPGLGSGIYRSTDNGASWSPANQGIVDSEIWSLLALDDGTIIAGGDDFIYRSRDGGSSWTRLINNTFIQRVPALVTNGAGTIYAGTVNNAIRSTDNGNTWSARIKMPGANYLLVDEILPTRAGDIYATTRGAGVFRLRFDKAEFWRRAGEGFPSEAVTAMTGRTTPIKYVATTGGIYRLHDSAGSVWTRTETEGAMTVTAMTDYNEGAFVVAGTTEGVHRFTNASRRWTPAGVGLPDGGVLAFAVNEPSGRIFAGTKHGIYMTDTNMLEWSPVTIGVDAEIDAITVTGSSTVLAAVPGQGIIRSTDLGATWSGSAATLPNRDITSFAVFGGKNVLAGTDGAGIYGSTDDGVTWSAWPGSLATERIVDLAFDSRGKVVVATDDGIFIQSSGTNWIGVNSEAIGPVTGMMITGSGDYLAAYEVSGLWQSTPEGTSSVPVEDEKVGTGRLGFHPNPAAADLSVAFSLDAPCSPRLVVSDAAGEIVARFEAGSRTAGDHALSIDLSRLSSGTYFLRIEGCGRIAGGSVSIVR